MNGAKSIFQLFAEVLPTMSISKWLGEAANEALNAFSADCADFVPVEGELYLSSVSIIY